MKWGTGVAAGLAALLVAPASALGALSVTRAELNGDRLRAEGRGANPQAAVQIDGGAAFGTPDSAGNWRVEASGFRSPTCVITVTDGQSTVQANLSGCTPSQAAPPPPPPSPNLLSPASGATVTQPVTLSWSQVTDPAGPIVGYDWEVATSSTFGATIRAWGVTGAPADGMPAPTSDRFSGLPNGTYFWRVRSMRRQPFSDFVKSNWSSVRSLVVSGSVAGTLAPPTQTWPPADKQYHPWEYFDITWNAVPGAAKYIIEYDDEPNFDFPISNIVGETTGTWASGGYGEEFGWIYWRVRAVNADGVRSLPSPVRRFGIFYTAPIPPPPTLVSPANGATIALPFRTDWSDVENAQPNGYVVELSRDPSFGRPESVAEWTAQVGPRSYYDWFTLDAGTWYWRVASCHGERAPDVSACTAWSAVGTFVVPAATPTLQPLILNMTSAFSGRRDTDNWPRGWVQLTSPAPAGGITVELASSNPAAATVPATVTVPAGEAIAAFDIDPLQVLVETPVTISATHGGRTETIEFLVKPPNLRRLDVGTGIPAHQVLPAGTSITVNALLNGRAPADGALVEFRSSSPDVVMPASQFVEPNGVVAPVTATTNRNVTSSVTATVTATWKGQTVSALITIHPPPTLLSPASGASFAQGSPIIFDWAELEGISYQIQIDDSPQFTAPIEVDYSPSRDSFFQSSSLVPGTHYWRVQTLDMYAHRGEWSEVRTVTITGASSPPATPTLQFPTDQARFSPGQTITFDWNDVNGASSYELQIDDSSTFGAPYVLERTGIGQSQFSTSTLPTRTMWWRVRARNTAGASAWSNARRVEVKS